MKKKNNPDSLGCQILLEMFHEVVNNNPNGVAIATEFNKITFQELEIQVSKYREFIGKELIKESPVAILSNKSVNNYAWMLACLFQGIPYVNLDMTAPTSRNLEILRLLDWPNIFVDLDQTSEYRKLIDVIDNDKYFLINSDLEKIWGAKKNRFSSDSLRQFVSTDSQTLAYIMFTSGSTGVPKGVAISQLGLVNLVKWARYQFSISSNSIMTGVNPLYFDNSVFDFYCSIFNGATLCSVTRDEFYNLENLRTRLTEMRCNLWFSVPSLIIYLMKLGFFNKEFLDQFKSILFGGEAFSKPLLKELMTMNSNVNFYNIYGPTEGTCICSAYLVTTDDLDDAKNKFVPIGGLNPGFDFRLEGIDKNGIGELILFGPNISPGYIGLEHENELKFGNVKELVGFGRRFYRTGDLFSIKEAKLYFEGRIDNQVKIMGHRVELEEIDVLASEFNGVKQAISFAVREKDESYSLGILFEMKDGFEQAELDSYLRSKLPNYMVPKHLLEVSQLPTNNNGKVARDLALQTFLSHIHQQE